MDAIEDQIRHAHIRYDGRSIDVPITSLDIGDGSTDREVKVALAVYLDVPPAKLDNYVIEREHNGNLTLRPEATFGME